MRRHGVAFFTSAPNGTLLGCNHLLMLETAMQLNLTVGPFVSLIAGILILVMPRLLNYIIALYLIIIGLVGLFGH